MLYCTKYATDDHIPTTTIQKLASFSGRDSFVLNVSQGLPSKGLSLMQVRFEGLLQGLPSP